MNDRNELMERNTVTEQIAKMIGIISTGFVAGSRLIAASALNDAIMPMLFGSPFVTGLLIGVLSAIQFRRRVPLTGIIVTVVVILSTWLLSSMWAVQSSVNGSGETVTWTCDYNFLAIMLLSSVIGAVVGGYGWRVLAMRIRGLV